MYLRRGTFLPVFVESSNFDSETGRFWIVIVAVIPSKGKVIFTLFEGDDALRKNNVFEISYGFKKIAYFVRSFKVEIESSSIQASIVSRAFEATLKRVTRQYGSFGTNAF